MEITAIHGIQNSHSLVKDVDENGYVCDENGYICLASDSLDKGTVVYTPLGKDGKVYDCGPGSDDILDVYVSW